jgi:hypothetical protein
MPRKRKAKPRTKRKPPGLLTRVKNRRDRLFLAGIIAAVVGSVVTQRQFQDALRNAPIEAVEHLKRQFEFQKTENAFWLFVTQATMILMGKC